MGNDFDQTWPAVAQRLHLTVSAAQYGSAQAASLYVPKVLAQTNQVNDPDGQIDPSAFAGFASDGRQLDSLLYGAVTQAKTAVAGGATAEQGLQSGRAWLDMAVQTLVADAGRSAVSAGIASRRQVGGWVRMLNPPSCSRCAVLAGKWFKWNAGFRRHPRCDCVHIPASESISGDLRVNPQALFQANQVTGLSVAQTKALNDGADMAKVVNATRGMSTTAISRGGRLTPEGIYRRADSRDDAIRLLKQHGYLT